MLRLGPLKPGNPYTEVMAIKHSKASGRTLPRFRTQSRIAIPGLAQDFGWSFLSQYGRFALQGASFILLARILEPEGLGLLSATIGFVNIVGPFAGLGSANLILKYLPRDRSHYPTSLGTAIIFMVVTGLLLTGIAASLGPLVLGKAFVWPVFLAMAISEMLSLRVVEIAASAFQAADRLDLSARTFLLWGALRLIATGLCWLLGAPATVGLYSALYLAMSLIGVAITCFMMTYHFREFGPPRFSLTHARNSVREGVSFSLGTASKAIYSDIDKAMLARLATVQAAGLYTAAYRLTTMAFLPALSLLDANLVRLFRSSTDGISSALRCAFTILPVLLSYTLLVGLAQYLAAPLVPIVLGHSYRECVVVLRVLALMPMIQITHFLLGEVLAGADRQGVRSLCQFGAAMVNIGMNLLLIPRHSWAGAVIATYVSEGLLAGAIVILVFSAWRGEKKLLKSNSIRQARLAGYSAGGIIAFEMARQLLRDRESVDPLFLIDTQIRRTVRESIRRRRFAEGINIWLSLVKHDVRNIQKDGLPSYIHAKIRKAALKGNLIEAYYRFACLCDVASDSISTLKIEAALWKAIESYVPQRLAVNAVLFRSSESLRDDIDPTLGWKGLIACDLEIYDLPGRHHTILSPVAVSQLADALQEKLRVSSQECRRKQRWLPAVKLINIEPSPATLGG